MKTSVKTIMMSFALMGCLIFSASDAMAQGRINSHGGSSSSRSQSAAVSSPNKSTAPTVTRASSSSSSVNRSAATPQVNRSSSSNSTVNRSTSTPQVNRSSSSSSSVNRSTSTPQVNRTSGSSSSVSRPSGSSINSSSSSSGSSTVSRRDDNRTTTIGTSGSSVRSGGASTRPGTSTSGNSGNSTSGNGNKGDIKGHSDRTGSHVTTVGARDNGTSITQKADPGKGNVSNISKPNGNGGKPDNGGKPNGNGGKPGNNGGKPDNNGGKPDNGGKPGNNGGKPGNNGGNSGHGGGNGHGGNGGHHGYDSHNRYDYNGHHYGNEFSWNYSHHNWSRPLPPPARPYHLSPWAWYRPIIPAGWYPYTGAPVIDRVLGLVFGTYYDVSLDHLYCDGYYIDGYADGVIYLRDVPMLNLYWPDVMLNYEYNRLVNAQFVYYSNIYDTSRYNRVYRSLSRIYGTPVYRDGMTISWYGGDSRGYVTLSMTSNGGGYYTTMSIGY